MNTRVMSFLTITFSFLTVSATSLWAMEVQSLKEQAQSNAKYAEYLLYLDLGDGFRGSSLGISSLHETVDIMESNAESIWYNRIYTQVNQQLSSKIINAIDIKAPYSWWVSSNQNDLAVSLQENGFIKHSSGQAMILDCTKCNCEVLDTSLKIKKAAAEEETDLWIMLSAQGFGFNQKIQEDFVKYIKNNVKLPTYPFYIVYNNGKPVATYLLIAHPYSEPKTVSLHLISTIPGLQDKCTLTKRLILQAICDAHNEGNKFMILLSSHESLSLYQELGFESYETYDVYVKKIQAL